MLALWYYAAAAGGMLIVLIILHLAALGAQGVGLPGFRNDAARSKRKEVRGVTSLVVGKDGRTSTSKIGAAMWTIGLCYVLLVLLIAGRSFDDTIDANYLLLLGGPFIALIGAKKITSDRVDSGKGKKTKAEPGGGISKRTAEVVTDDDGDVDIGDFQYLAFNLITFAYFIVAFVRAPDGLPELSDTMVALTSASAAGYLGKKAVTPEPAFKIRSVVPGRVIIGETDKLQISGSGFYSGDPDLPQPGEQGSPNAVLLDEVKLETANWTDTWVEADLGLSSAGLKENHQAELVVVNDLGDRSEPLSVKVEERD